MVEQGRESAGEGGGGREWRTGNFLEPEGTGEIGLSGDDGRDGVATQDRRYIGSGDWMLR